MSDESAGMRRKIIGAFNRTMLGNRRGRPSMRDIVSEAGVARSTVYEHFDGKDGLLIEAFKGPLSVIADATVTQSDAHALEKVLRHFRERRADAAEILGGPLSRRIMRALAGLIEERLPTADNRETAALHLAAMQLSSIHLWLNGDTRHTPADLARLMCDCAKAQRKVLLAEA